MSLIIRPIENAALNSRRRNAETDVQCPVEPGDYTIEQVAALPKEIPRGE